MMKAKTGFCLNKWYLDCVTDDGNAFIVYNANLTWNLFNFTYSSLLEFDGSKTNIETSLLNEEPPMIKDNLIAWQSNKLKFKGRWKNLGESYSEQKLFSTLNGSIIWTPISPLSETTLIKQNSKNPVTGLGYVESISISIPPNQLPINKLIWGRFISNDISLIWINWEGNNPLNILLFNGEKFTDASITKESISWKDGKLYHENYSVLREGDLFNTTLKYIPGISKIINDKMLNLYESKWLSKSKLEMNGKLYSGWTIHEVVNF